ncbi:MAG: hypothetical protein GX877_04285 [Bacteroidales bacterium]|nr:hypothetical protein [Bacteroidales bacterium]
MKKTALTIASLIAVQWLLLVPANAQTIRKGVTEAAIGTELNEILPDDMIYMYPEFQKGTVLFLDRSSAEASMNIYLPGSELHFIDASNDTLAVKNQDAARLLSLGADTYLRHDKIWVRILATGNEAAFCLRSVVNVHTDQRIGAYGTPDATSAISNVNMMYGVEGGTTVRLKSLRKIPYSITHYALLYDGQKLYNATKRNFRRLFPNRRADIDKYISENKLNLSRAKDALQLYNFLSD